MKKLLLLLLVLTPLSNALAETPEQKGLAIAQKLYHRNTGWGDSQATMRMILRAKNGRQSIREIRVKTLEEKNDGDKGLTIFDDPRDIKGTAFLSFSHSLKADEQWLFLPALKRVKRISSSNKSGPFMGSEFAYEDISSFEVDKYKYRYIRDDLVDGHAVFVVEMIPQYTHSGYTRELAWIDQKEYIMRKINYFDRKNALLKTLVFSNYKLYLGHYWRALEMEMTNHQKGKGTTLIWENYRFRTGLNDSDFRKSKLMRAR